MAASLPTPGGDVDTWGDELNAYLSVGLNPDGTLKQSAITPPIVAGPAGPAGPSGPAGSPGGFAIDVTQHGVTPGTTDSAAALVALINSSVAAAQADGTNYVELAFRPGRYTIAAAPTKGGATKGNAQIPLPIIDPTLQKVTLALVGTKAGDTLAHWDQLTGQKAGVFFYTTATGAADATFGAASVLGGPTPQQGYGNATDALFSNMHVVLDGIAVVSSTLNPTMIPFDLRGVAQMTVGSAGAFVDAPTSAVSSTYPNNNWVCGLLPPNDRNNDLVNMRSWSCEGYYAGVGVSEHCVYETVRLVSCSRGIAINTQDYAHGNLIGYASVENCAFAVEYETYTHCDITLLDLERPEHPSPFEGGNDINDVGNNGRGCIGFISSGPGTGESTPPVVNGGANLKIINRARHPGVMVAGTEDAPAVPASGTPLANPFWRDCMVTCSGTITAYHLTNGADATTTLGLTGSATVPVPSGATLTLTYTGTVTMTWVVL